MKIPELFSGVKYRTIGDVSLDISSLACDTTKVQDGGAFFCLNGTKIDGHDFAEVAVQKGAKLLVCTHALDLDVPQIIVNDTRSTMARCAGNFWGNPRDKLSVIGVTGTNGKTTTTYMLQSILQKAGKKVGVIGTIGVVIDNIKKPAELTTPDPIEMHKIFAEMVNAGVDTVVMEVSAHAIALQKMTGVICDVGILTNVTQDHIDFFKTFDNYANTKRSFISPQFCKLGVVNIDDAVGKSIVLDNSKTQSQFHIATYGLYNPCDVFAVKYKYSMRGTQYILNLFDDIKSVNTKLIGQFNLYNALGAATACKLLGVSTDDIVKGLCDMEFVPGRFNVIHLPNDSTVVIDYAHTPDGLLNILTAVRKVTDKRIISVFGCGGNRDSAKRPIMGQISGENADFSIITSDNPRLENPNDIIKDVEKGICNVTDKYLCIPDRRDAIRFALRESNAGDVVVISGKGAENYLDIGGVKYPYNDTDTVYNEYAQISNQGARQQ